MTEQAWQDTLRLIACWRSARAALSNPDLREWEHVYIRMMADYAMCIRRRLGL